MHVLMFRFTPMYHIFMDWSKFSNHYGNNVVHSQQRSHGLLHKDSYMIAHVLLNLLNELGKRDKMRGLPSILSLFRTEFNKFNNTRARMLDSIYQMTLRFNFRI